MDETKKPYSYHVFLFPFSWDLYNVSPKGGNSSFEDRTNIGIFDKLLDEAFWQKLDLSKDPVNYYNDYAFFHTAVREAIFGKMDGGSQMVRNYERKNTMGGFYEIKVKKRPETYRLALDQIRLNVYDTGVGILSFYCSNADYPDWKQVLEINDFGRRIYPQFLDTASNESTGGDLLEQVRGAFLAERIQVIDATGRLIFSEDFSYVAQSLNLVVSQPVEWSFLSGKMVHGLFGSTDFSSKRQPGSKELYAHIEPILDDRMFVACWYGNDAASNQLKTTFQDPKQTDMWMKYMFVDNSSNSCQSEPMQQELLRKHTYHRWANYSTFYGVTRYSLVALTDQGDFGRTHIKDHVKGRYLELAQLSLAQRASCQRFSHEINNLASLDDKAMKREADSIHREYLRFVNKLYFLEATPQEQGIELFTMLQENMRVKDEIDFLNTELTDLYEFLSLREANEQSKAANQFAWVATIFLPASLVAAIFGFSTIDKDTNFWQWPSCLSFWVPLLITTTAIIVAPKLLRQANGRRAARHNLKK